jgi:hypothetical protein
MRLDRLVQMHYRQPTGDHEVHHTLTAQAQLMKLVRTDAGSRCDQAVTVRGTASGVWRG